METTRGAAVDADTISKLTNTMCSATQLTIRANSREFGAKLVGANRRGGGGCCAGNGQGGR